MKDFSLPTTKAINAIVTSFLQSEGASTSIDGRVTNKLYSTTAVSALRPHEVQIVRSLN